MTSTTSTNVNLNQTQPAASGLEKQKLKQSEKKEALDTYEANLETDASKKAEKANKNGQNNLWQIKNKHTRAAILAGMRALDMISEKDTPQENIEFKQKVPFQNQLEKILFKTKETPQAKEMAQAENNEGKSNSNVKESLKNNPQAMKQKAAQIFNPQMKAALQKSLVTAQQIEKKQAMMAQSEALKNQQALAKGLKMDAMAQQKNSMEQALFNFRKSLNFVNEPAHKQSLQLMAEQLQNLQAIAHTNPETLQKLSQQIKESLKSVRDPETRQALLALFKGIEELEQDRRRQKHRELFDPKMLVKQQRERQRSLFLLWFLIITTVGLLVAGSFFL